VEDTIDRVGQPLLLATFDSFLPLGPGEYGLYWELILYLHMEIVGSSHHQVDILPRYSFFSE